MGGRGGGVTCNGDGVWGVNSVGHKYSLTYIPCHRAVLLV